MISDGPRTLSELRDRSRGTPPWLLDLVLPDVGGGRFDTAQLDEIGLNPGNALRVSGLNQESFEAVIARYGTQVSAIQFWKCPRIEDFSPLEGFPNLRLVSIFWNQRTTRLWDLTRTPRLVGLHFDDFTRLHDLSDVSRGGNLVELEFGDAIWDKSVFATLEPLAALTGLISLKLSAKRIEDGRIEPLAALQQLERLSFASNQFTTRQVAWLRSRLPDSLQSEAIAPLRRISPPLRGDTKDLDVLLVGKRKPFLNSAQDEKRIRKHVEDFDRLVAEFRADPSLLPG